MCSRAKSIQNWSLFLPVLILMAVSMLMQIVVIKCWIFRFITQETDQK